MTHCSKEGNRAGDGDLHRSEVYEEEAAVLVVNDCGVNARAGGVVEGDIARRGVPGNSNVGERVPKPAGDAKSVAASEAVGRMAQALKTRCA